VFIGRYGNRNMGSINSTKTILEERIETRIFLDFWVHFIRIGRLKEALRECGNDILEEMIDMTMKRVVVVPKSHCNVLIEALLLNMYRKKPNFSSMVILVSTTILFLLR
jgi:hypothetical protein